MLALARPKSRHQKKEYSMRARFTKLAVTLAALAALAVGGSALANAAQSKSHANPAPPVVANTPAATAAETPAETADAADTDTLQQGDQTGADTPDPAGSAAESATESASESAASDGPGGHADPSDTADTQQQGTN
jgi:hypothetical protein